MRANGELDYLELPAGNGRLDSVKAFYASAFGWAFTDYGPTYAAFDEGLEGGFQADVGETPARPLPVLYSDALEAALAAVESAGRHRRQADLLLPGRPPLPFRRPRRQRARRLGAVASGRLARLRRPPWSLSRCVASLCWAAASSQLIDSIAPWPFRRLAFPRRAPYRSPTWRRTARRPPFMCKEGRWQSGSTASATARRRAARRRNLLGGKGANLAEMAASACRSRPASPSPPRSATCYYANGQRLSRRAAGRGRGGARPSRATDRPAASATPSEPLLVSVRSGARASMPGMMDTVLNLGLNDETVEALAREAGDARFAYDTYRRFIQMYGDVVLGVDHDEFEAILEIEREGAARRELDTDLDAGRLAGGRRALQGAGRGDARHAVPAGARGAALGRDRRRVRLVDERRAPIAYRQLHDIPGELGHGRQRAGDGVRQHGRDLRHRRRLHPQPVDRREGALRRVPRQRPGRGRGGRHPHAAGPSPRRRASRPARTRRRSRR